MSQASSVFTAAPHRLHYHLSSTSCRIGGGIRLSQEWEPACELHIQGIQVAPYKNHSETSPSHSVCGKIIFHETGPWYLKGWGLLKCHCDAEIFSGSNAYSQPSVQGLTN